MKKIIKSFSLVLIVAFVASSCKGNSKKTVAAEVDGEPIYKEDILKDWEELKKSRFQNSDIPEEQLEKIKEQYYPQLLEQAVNQKVIDKVIEQKGIKATDEEVSMQYDRLKSSRPNLEKTLKDQGMTVEGAKEELSAQIAVRELYNSVIEDVKEPTEEELKEYYEKNKDQFSQTEQIKASHILLQVTEGATEEEKTEKKKKLESILKRARAGADFAELARNNSEGPSAKRGGDLGFFGKGRMVPAFEKAAFSLKKGEISDIVQTQFGYHIIKVTDKKEASQETFSQIKPDLKEQLLQQKKQEKFQDWLETKKDELVEYKGKEL